MSTVELEEFELRQLSEELFGSPEFSAISRIIANLCFMEKLLVVHHEP